MKKVVEKKQFFITTSYTVVRVSIHKNTQSERWKKSFSSSCVVFFSRSINSTTVFTILFKNTSSFFSCLNCCTYWATEWKYLYFTQKKWKRKLNGYTKNFFLWRSFPIHISNTYYFILLLLTFPSFYLSLWSSYQAIISFHRTTYRSNNNISKSSTQTVSFVVFWVATHASWFILLFPSIVAYFNIIISIQRTFSLCIATQVFFTKKV